MTLLKDIQQIPSSKKHLREFGWTVGGVLLAFGCFFLWKGKPYAAGVIAASSVLIGAGFLIPGALKPLQIAWMTLALLIGWVMSRVILGLVFYLVITPLGLILKATGKGIRVRRAAHQTSDWVERPRKEINHKNQF